MWGDSIYACAVAAGWPAAAANAAQAAGMLAAIAVVWAAFRLHLPGDQRIAALLAAILLAAPHSSLGDMVLLATAAALWSGEAASRGETLAKWTLALALWLAPLFNPPLVSAVGRLTPLIVLGFAVMTIAPAWRETALGRSPPLGSGFAAED